MKIHTTMPKALKPYYRKELLDAKDAFAKKYYRQSWRHLERAHIRFTGRCCALVLK